VISTRATVVAADESRVLLEARDWPGHKPGQFAMLGLDPDRTHRDPLLPRPMAVYRQVDGGLEFRFKVVGRGTKLLSGLRRGDVLSLLGPLGNGFPAPRPGDWLVGGGTGIASLYELARDAPRGVRVRLGGRSRGDILGLTDFEALGADLAVATDDGSAGAKGFVTEIVTPAAGETVFACGPDGMMRRAHQLATAAGASCLVSLENNMACGFGVCLGCAVRTRTGFRYVCTHGPVFPSETLPWSTA